MEDQNKIEIIRPFGPLIAKVKIPQEIIDELNNYVDKVVSDEKKSEEQDHGKHLVGNVTQEFILDKDFAEKSGWLQFLGNCTSAWINIGMKHKISEFKVIKTWIVRQFENEYNPIHWHSGHISGAGFLKLPNNFGETFQKEKVTNHNGKLELIHGSRAFLSNAKFTITPQVGDFYFFPHYLMHQVYPFSNNKDERRSISFNALVDKKVFDVFGY